MTRHLQRLNGCAISLLCFLAGALLTLGFAPVEIWPVGFISIPILLTALQSAASWRAAMSRAFFFGYGYSMAGTYWVGNALLVDAEKFGWMWPISLLGLSAVMALWFVVMGGVFYMLRGESTSLRALAKQSILAKQEKMDCFASARNDGVCGTRELVPVIRLAAIWMLVEYARTWGIIVFPWNFLGSMALSVLPVAQLISVLGTYGMSFLLVLLFALPVVILREPFGFSSRHKAGLTVTTAIALFAITFWGYSRIPAVAPMTGLSVRVVQGNIPQSLKWSEAGELQAERVYSRLTQSPSAMGAIPTTIVWPETAVPIPLRTDSIWPQQVAKLLPNGGVLLTGALRVDSAPDSGERRIWNSLVVITSKGEIPTIYDKHQLVPFGEFVPFRDVLPLDKITPGDTDFSRGEGAKTLAVEGVLLFRPLICYEVVFPLLSAEDPRPQWLVNITNDGWYGNSSGPYQHLAASRLRAIEQGLPLVRAANTGISAVIDPYGRVLQSLPLGMRGIIDQKLPAALPPTPYARFGNGLAWALALLAWIATILPRKREKIK